MSLILRYCEGRKAKAIPIGTSPNPQLEQKLKKTQKQLNLILNKWKFGAETLTTADQFLAKFESWINGQLEKQKELQEFCQKYSVNTLEELAEYIANLPTEETPNPELANFLELWGATSLAQVKETWTNTEADYLSQIENLKENRAVPEDYAQEIKDLTTEKDQLTREKKTLEQENLAFHNQLRNKSKEVNQKEKALQQLKKEKSQSEIALNQTITELRKDQDKLQKKYSKQGKLLDEEQLECKKLEEQIEKLQAEIKELKKPEAEYIFD